MSSGYPDDPRDRDYDDPDRRDDRDGGAGRRDEDDIRRARQKVSVPAVGLIVVGALTIISCVFGVIQVLGGQFDRVFDDMVQQVQADPNMPAAQKQEWTDAFNNARDFVKAYGPVLYGAGALVGLVVLVGGLRLKALGSTGLVIVSSLLAMLPFSACCLLGLVFGIWALVALANPDVKAGFAAKRRLARPPDPY